MLTLHINRFLTSELKFMKLKNIDDRGFVMDVMVNAMSFSVNYCFSDLQTEWAKDLGEKLLDKAMNNPMLSIIFPLSIINNPFTLGPISPGLFISLGISAPAAEALAGSTLLARNPLSAALVATFILTFVGGYYICETYDLKPAPRNLEEDLEICAEYSNVQSG